MMISSEIFVLSHKKDSYETLLKVRDNLIKEIRAYEKKQVSLDEWMIKPSPETIYQCNLEYLGKLCEYISERYNQEFINGEEDEYEV